MRANWAIVKKRYLNRYQRPVITPSDSILLCCCRLFCPAIEPTHEPMREPTLEPILWVAESTCLLRGLGWRGGDVGGRGEKEKGLLLCRCQLCCLLPQRM